MKVSIECSERSERSEKETTMDNILSYVIVPYLKLKRGLKLVEVYGELIWRGIAGRREKVKYDFISDNFMSSIYAFSYRKRGVRCKYMLDKSVLNKRIMMRCIENKVITISDCLVICCRFGYLECVKILVGHADIDRCKNNLALILACKGGHLNVVRELLKDGRVDPSASYNTAIISASKNGYLEIVKELMKNERVDPSAEYNRALRYAINNRHIDIVIELLKDPRVKIKI